jgi:hypothetical protein
MAFLSIGTDIFLSGGSQLTFRILCFQKRWEQNMNSAALSQSMLYRRYRSGKSIETRIWFKRLAAVLIFLTCYIVPIGNHPAYAESDDALFIDQNGNVGIGTHEPKAKLDVTGNIIGVGMVPPGGIVMFSGDIDKSFDAEGTGLKNTPYAGWQLCNGKNGAPDLRGRFALGTGQGPNLTNRVMGLSGGEETHILANNEIPIHDHQATIPVYRPRFKVERIYHGWNYDRRYCFGETVTKPTVKTNPAGGGIAHNNMPPFHTLAFIMRLP